MPAVLEQRPRGRLAVGPDALLEGAAELGHVRVPDDLVALVVERGVEEEAVVLDLEMLVLFANAALAQGEQLLALGERTHGNSPFFQSDWHKKGNPPARAQDVDSALGRHGTAIVTK